MDLLYFSSKQFSEYQKPEYFGNLTARLLYIIPFFFITSRKSPPNHSHLGNPYLMQCHLRGLVFDGRTYISIQV